MQIRTSWRSIASGERTADKRKLKVSDLAQIWLANAGPRLVERAAMNNFDVIASKEMNYFADDDIREILGTKLMREITLK